MKRWILWLLGAACLVIWVVALLLFSRFESPDDDITLPTLMVLPTLTSSPVATTPPTLLVSPTDVATLPLPASETPTIVSTLATRVLVIRAVMPGVTILPTMTPVPPDIVLLPAPPLPAEPLPDATNTMPPFEGWYSFESDYPAVRYDPPWSPRLAEFASRGQYHRTEAPSGMVRFGFEGEGLRVRYVAARNMGIFDIVVDGIVIDSVDAYATDLTFPGTQVYFVGSGTHLLEIRATGRKNDASEGYTVALDAIQVFRSDAHTIISPLQTLTPTTPLQEVARINLVGAPPTLQMTATPLSPSVLTPAVLIAYDENHNGVADPAEGAAGISVRVVETTSNRVIASNFTDAQGYARFELVTQAPIRVVVPYFGESWEVTRGSGRGDTPFTLLLDPANQPGLVP